MNTIENYINNKIFKNTVKSSNINKTNNDQQFEDIKYTYSVELTIDNLKQNLHEQFKFAPLFSGKDFDTLKKQAIEEIEDNFGSSEVEIIKLNDKEYYLVNNESDVIRMNTISGTNKGAIILLRPLNAARIVIK